MKDENKFRHFSFSIKVNFGTLQNCFFIAYWLHDLKHYLIKNPNMYSGSFILSQFYSFCGKCLYCRVKKDCCFYAIFTLSARQKLAVFQ